MTDRSIPLEEARRRSMEAQRPLEPRNPGRAKPQNVEDRARTDGFVYASELAHRPLKPRQWVVDGIVPMSATTLFSGDGGTGKSLLAMDLLTAATSGGRWLGRDVRQCRSVFVSAEDDLDEMQRRLATIGQRKGINFGDYELNLGLFDKTSTAGPIITRDPKGNFEPSMFWCLLSNLVIDTGVELLVLDSLYNFFGGNEISRTDVTAFMDELNRLALDAECAIVVLWHPSVSGRNDGTGTSGSTAFRNRARQMLYLTPPSPESDDDPDTRTLTVTKSNYGKAGVEFKLRWSDGIFAVEDGPDDEAGMLGTIKRRNREKAANEAFLKALDAIAEQGRYPSVSPNSPSYAPKLALSTHAATGFSRKAMIEAMNRLLAEKELRVGVRRKPNRHCVECLMRYRNDDDT